jgi:predicted PurR-regulated permease PerM
MAKGDDAKGSADRRSGAADWQSLHLWQIQPVRDVLLVLAIFGVLYFGYLISVVTIPLLLALMLAYLFEPIVQRLSRISWMSRQGAAAAIIVAAVVVIVVPAALATGFAIVQGAGFAQEFAASTRQLVASIENPEDESLRAGLRARGGSWLDIRDAVVEAEAAEAARLEAEQAAERAAEEAAASGEAPPPEGEETAGDDEDDLSPLEDVARDLRTSAAVAAYETLRYLGSWVDRNRELAGQRAIAAGQGALSAALSVLTRVSLIGFGAFLTAFFFFFMSSSFGKVLAFFRELLPDEHEERIVELAGKMDGVIAGFVRGRLTIAAIQSVIFVVAYWAIGVPAPLIIGPIVGFLSIVPYVALVGIPVSMLLLWLEPSGGGFQGEWWWIVGAPIVVYFVVQALDDYVLTPLIQGKSTNMETPFILFASLAGGALAGVYGLLLGIPVAACAKILITEVVWPRFEQWKQGNVKDPLPFGREKE